MVTPELKSEAATLLEQARAAMQAGDKESAKKLLHRLVEVEPGHEAGWLWLASLYTELPVIAHCLQEAVHINPQNAQAAQALHAVLQRIHHAEGSRPVNGQAAAASPSPGAPPVPPLAGREEGRQFDFEELKRRGIVAGKGGRRDEARQHLLAACELNDSDAETWFWLSTVVDDPEDRQIALENVLTLDPLHEAAQAAYDENSQLLVSRQTPPDPAPPQPDVTQPEAPQPEVPGTVLLETAALEHALAPAPSFSPPVETQAVFTPSPAPQPEQALSFAPPEEPAQAPILDALREVQPHDEAHPTAKVGAPFKLFAQSGKSDTEAEAPRKQKVDEEETVIAGKYRIVNRTEGTWGPNYVVCDVKNKRFFTLQAQRPDALDTKKGGINTLSHKGQTFSIIQMGTDGLTLRNFVSTVGRLPAEIVAQYGVELLKALSVEHAKGTALVERKVVAPDSLTFNSTGALLLNPPNQTLLVSASSVQVRPFLPPEQANHGTLATTSDIYSIGALLFFMLTGAPPPPSEGVPKKHGDTFFPGHFVDFPELPEDFARVIAAALQPNPGDRYASANDMANAIRSTDAGRHVKREFPKKLLAVAGGLVVVGIVAWVVMSGRLSNINLNLTFIDTLTGNQGLSAGPAPTPLPSTPVPPPPLARAVVNGVDSRLFPANTLYFSALDTNGLPMFGFQRSMVKLRENGTEVVGFQLTELRKTTDAISVMVALDTSDRMGGRIMDDAKTGIHILADLLQPGDRMAFFTYGGAGRADLDYTVSKTAFLAAVDPQQAGGKPALSVADVVNLASDRASRQVQGGYTSLVIISNGGLPGDVSGMVRAANTANLAVFFVGMDRATYPEQAAGRLAQATGGVALVAETPDTGGLGEAVKKLEKMLHNVYKLSYDSPAPSANVPHEVELTLTVGPLSQGDKRAYVVWPR